MDLQKDAFDGYRLGAIAYGAGTDGGSTCNSGLHEPTLSPERRVFDLVHRMTLAEKASQMQNNSAAIPRLNVPAYQWWSEALHGVIDPGVTEYPKPIGLAATFDAPWIHTTITSWPIS